MKRPTTARAILPAPLRHLMVAAFLLHSSALVLPPAIAQDTGDAVFQRYDKNSDGKVTKEELPHAPTFARFDRNKDGAITVEEYHQVKGATEPTPPAPVKPAAGAARIDAIAKAVDKNADGRITREEAAGAQWFDRADQNADDVIDAEEIALLKKIGAGGRGTPSTAPAISPEDLQKVTSGPEILKPGDVGIGRMIPDVPFTDLEGKQHRLSDLQSHQGIVVAMTSATCPVSKRYLPSLASLEKGLAGKDIAFLLVNPYASESAEEIRAQLAGQAFAAPYIRDEKKTLTVALQASTTTEIFLLDAARTLVYRGALDDQYGINYSLDAPRHHYLADAVDALVDGKRPAVEATAAPGCELDLGDAPKLSASPVTYHRDVARILQQNCVQCHHDEGIAPFALDDFDEVGDRTRVIKRVVSEGTMPPWFAAPPADGGPSPWANDRSLSSRDKADLLAWLESSDKPVGDPADAPAPRSFPSEWTIGTPDLVIPLSRPFEVSATGFMPYQRDSVETELTEDKWVTAYEILPTARDVVHHVIVQVFEKGSTVRDHGEGDTGYWAAYVPGNGAHVYPEGFARKLPAGATVRFTIHYTPSGTARKDRLKLGLVFADEPPLYAVKTLPLADRQLNIPPGAPAHEEGMSRPLPFDLAVMGFMAHMHTRGAAFKYEVTYPDGREEVLLDIPRYDFNWQLRYDLKEPILIPRGSVMKVTGVFDNSPGNRANPDPTATVRRGPQTYNEMLIGYVNYFTPISGAKVAEQ